jgi:hypothetical protein
VLLNRALPIFEALVYLSILLHFSGPFLKKVGGFGDNIVAIRRRSSAPSEAKNERDLRLGIPEGVILRLMSWVGNSAMLSRYAFVATDDLADGVKRRFNSTNDAPRLNRPDGTGNISSSEYA